MAYEGKRQAEESEALRGYERLKVSMYAWLQAGVTVLAVLILLFTLVGRVIGVDGSSMYPTLHDGDMVLLQSLGYTPRVGDVVVLTQADSAFTTQPIIKRIVATGGQTVEVNYADNAVYVDGVALNEPYLVEPMYDRGGSMTNLDLTVPEGSVFVMGDNRNGSSDSRDVRIGTVDERCILGRALCIALPRCVEHGLRTEDFGMIETWRGEG